MTALAHLLHRILYFESHRLLIEALNLLMPSSYMSIFRHAASI
jgi:hypothetical protein